MSFQRSGFILENSGSFIRDTYDLAEVSIGEGSYGVVRRGVHKISGQTRAVKIIPRDRLKLLPRFRDEVKIMKELEHPNIIRLFETFEDDAFIYLVMELCEGGELFDRIIATGFFGEREAACTVRQMLGALFYLHRRGVCHRDLKPENFLLSSSLPEADLKLIDFGLSARVQAGVALKTRSGTPYYVAPEVLSGSYDEKCDLWSIGVLTYVLLCGYPPFNGNSDKDILVRVKSGKFVFPDSEWKTVSASAKDFVSKLLELKPANRMSAKEALEHPWIRESALIAKGSSQLVDPLAQERILSSLRSFRGISKFKKLALTAIAHQLLDSEINELKRTFASVDSDGDGTLNVSEIREALVKAGIRVPHDIETLMAEIDSDGSGSVDYMEFIAATMDRKLYNQKEVAWRAFCMFDQDGDGKISARELAKLLKMDSVQSNFDKEKLDEIIKEFDLNSDGEIDFEEFSAMVHSSSEK